MTGDVQPLTIRLPAPLYEKLRKRAFDQRIPMNQLVIDALEKTEKDNENR